MRLMTHSVLAQNASCAAASAYPIDQTPMSKVLPSDWRSTW